MRQPSATAVAVEVLPAQAVQIRPYAAETAAVVTVGHHFSTNRWTNASVRAASPPLE